METTEDDAGPTISARRKNMQAIRRRDTRPELALRSLLHAAGHRYRTDRRMDFPSAHVRPDIVFTRRRLAVFVDGCFWHSCPEHGAAPKLNSSWGSKLQANRERDARNNAALREQGWTVLRIWEHTPRGNRSKKQWQRLRLGPRFVLLAVKGRRADRFERPGAVGTPVSAGETLRDHTAGVAGPAPLREVA